MRPHAIPPASWPAKTYAVSEAEGGTDVRWTMNAVRDQAGAAHEEATKEMVDFLSEFWPPAFDRMEKMLGEA